MNKDYAHSMQDDLISRQDALNALYGSLNLDTGIAKIELLPSAEPKTMNKTNANKIYSYLKERIDDTVDDMKEFDAWFERMVWHVKECDRLAKEPKTGKWIIHDEVKNIYGGIYIECSECGTTFVTQTLEDERFCRNCGARMRREDGEEE